MEQLTRKVDELRRHQEDLMEVCETQDFNEGLQNVQEKLKKQQE